jgi:hypothetical protein
MSHPVKSAIRGGKIMKKIFVSLFVSLVLITSTHANTMYAVGVGFSVDASSLDAISQATRSYNLLGDTHGSNPANSLPTSLGTINLNEGGLLQLANASAKTWQSGGDSANAVNLSWRVYETGAANKGSYSSYNVLYGNSFDSFGNLNKFWSSTGSVNLLQNVAAGTVELPKYYTVEMYAVADFTWSNGGGSGNFNSTVNNSGTNFTTQFTAIPEPSTGMLMGMGFAGLLVVRRIRKSA